MARLLRIITIAGIAMVTFAATSAMAQTQRVPCGERAAIMAHLDQTYSEKPVAIGLDARGRVLEVLAAPSGSWTMLMSTPGGTTCLIASGVAWQDVPVDGIDPAV